MVSTDLKFIQIYVFKMVKNLCIDGRHGNLYSYFGYIYIVTHMSSKFQDELSYLIIFEIYPSADSEIIADNIKKF